MFNCEFTVGGHQRIAMYMSYCLTDKLVLWNNFTILWLSDAYMFLHHWPLYVLAWISNQCWKCSPIIIYAHICINLTFWQMEKLFIMSNLCCFCLQCFQSRLTVLWRKPSLWRNYMKLKRTIHYKTRSLKSLTITTRSDSCFGSDIIYFELSPDVIKTNILTKGFSMLN